MKQKLLAGLILLICIISQSCTTDCSKETQYHPDCGCPSDKTVFDETCINSGNYTFYSGLVDFYCFQDSIAIGIDNVEKKAILWHTENGGFGSTGPITYSVVNGDGFSANECTVDGFLRSTFLIFEDKSTIDDLPSKINFDLYLKESAIFGSSTIDSTQLTVSRI